MKLNLFCEEQSLKLTEVALRLRDAHVANVTRADIALPAATPLNSHAAVPERRAVVAKAIYHQVINLGFHAKSQQTKQYIERARTS